jgi:hypothetical protein
VRTSTVSLFWQGFFIIAIKVERNTTSQHLILANSYANGVPNSATRIFSKYFKFLEYNFTSAGISKFSSSIDKLENPDRKWSLG